MHIVYFHQHFGTPKSKAGIRSYQMAFEAVRQGHEVTMICGSYTAGDTGLSGPYQKGRRTGTVDGITVVEFDLSYSNKDGLLRRTLTFMKFASNSIWLALTLKYDLVFATSTPLTVGLPGIFARWLRKKPFVFEVRDLWPELPREMGVISNPLVLWSMSMLEWASYRSAHRLIGLSPGIVKGIERRGVHESRIVMIPNGCDNKIFGQEDLPSQRPANVAKHDIMAIFAGTHGRANGLVAVLDAAEELKRRSRTDVKFVLVGEGRCKPDLMRLASENDLDNVIFLDPVPKAELAELMTAADLGIQCLANVPAFYYGTSPNKFFDYIASGLPVLNNYPGWLAEMIAHANCGFAVTPDDPVAFADAMESAADDRLALLAMGRNSRKLALSEFDRDRLARQWVAWVADSTHLTER